MTAEAGPPPGSAKDARTAEPTERRRLAFVLLDREALPRAGEIIAAFRGIAPAAQRDALAIADGADGGDGKVVLLDLGKDGRLMVGLQSRAVPGREADHHARFSLPGAANDWELPPHRAHLVVVWMEEPRLPARASLERFTWLLAAVAEAAHAVGVYWGDSGATHRTELFVASARAGNLENLVLVWSGVSVAADRGNRDRMSLLSLGMTQLELPELELSVPRSCEKGPALRFFYALLAHVAQRGAALPDGDTVGRTAGERLPVRYAPSPVDREKTVCRIELPECTPGQRPR